MTFILKIKRNHNQIKADVKQIVADELKRISEDENLKHLIKACLNV
jgi:hypothetical protein